MEAKKRKPRITEKTFELIKGMLNQGYSVKKVYQMLPEQIKVSTNSIYKISNVVTYDEFRGIKKVPEPEKKTPTYVTHTQHTEILDAIAGMNERFDKITSLFEELIGMLR